MMANVDTQLIVTLLGMAQSEGFCSGTGKTARTGLSGLTGSTHPSCHLCASTL